MDIRKQTHLIIRRGNEYLVGRIIYSTEYRWSSSPWEAWRTRDRDAAEELRQRVGGTIMLFNPVARQLREYRRES